LLAGNGVKAELSAEADIPFALPVVKKVPVGSADSDDERVVNETVLVSEKSVNKELVFAPAELVELVTAALDTREVIELPKVVVRNNVVVRVYEVDSEALTSAVPEVRWEAPGSPKVVVGCTVVVRV
jgi:hypothetical protein